MTFEKKLKKYLTDRGMFDSDADKVFEIYRTNPMSQTMSGRWTDDADDYPPVMFNLLAAGLRTVARKWLADNAPMAWFRPIFDD